MVELNTLPRCSGWKIPLKRYGFLVRPPKTYAFDTVLCFFGTQARAPKGQFVASLVPVRATFPMECVLGDVAHAFHLPVCDLLA